MIPKVVPELANSLGLEVLFHRCFITANRGNGELVHRGSFTNTGLLTVWCARSA